MSSKSRNVAIVATAAFSACAIQPLESRTMFDSVSMGWSGPDFVTPTMHDHGFIMETTGHGADSLAIEVSVHADELTSSTTMAELKIYKIGKAAQAQRITCVFADEPSQLNINTGDGDDRIIVTATGAIANLGNFSNSSMYVEVNTGADNDRIESKALPVNIVTEEGNDTVYGSQYSDFIVTGAGNDHVFARGGDDWIVLGAGADVGYGGDGNDNFYFYFTSYSQFNQFDSLRDTIVGGAGYDSVQISYSSADATYLPSILIQLGKTKVYSENISVLESDKG